MPVEEVRRHGQERPCGNNALALAQPRRAEEINADERDDRHRRLEQVQAQRDEVGRGVGQRLDGAVDVAPRVAVEPRARGWPQGDVVPEAKRAPEEVVVVERQSRHQRRGSAQGAGEMQRHAAPGRLTLPFPREEPDTGYDDRDDDTRERPRGEDHARAGAREDAPPRAAIARPHGGV